ncbi:MAG: hypothetical protein WDN01_00045 [Rhizomicrobium sp.]
MASKRATTAASYKKQSQPHKSVPGAKQEPSYRENQVKGGETHQIASDGVETLTTQQGIPVADDQNT